MWRTFFRAHSSLQGLGVLLEALGLALTPQTCCRRMLRGLVFVPALIDQHELQNASNFTEFIPDNLVPVFMQACDDVVLPLGRLTEWGHGVSTSP